MRILPLLSDSLEKEHRASRRLSDVRKNYVKWNNKIFTKNCNQKLGKDILQQFSAVVWENCFC